MSNDDSKYHKPVILQVLPALNSGGVERGTIEIAQAITKAGFESIVVSSGGRMVDCLKKTQTRHISLNVNSKNPITIIRNIAILKQIIKENNVSIVHARSRAPAWSAYFAAKSANIKFVTTFHGTYNFKNFIKKYYNSIMTRGDKVIAVSKFVEEHIKQNYQLDYSKIVTIARGADINKFNPTNIDNTQIELLKEKLRIPNNRLVIALPGRITRWKGHEYVIEALNMLPRGKFYTIFVGDSVGHESYKESLKAKLTSCRLQYLEIDLNAEKNPEMSKIAKHLDSQINNDVIFLEHYMDIQNLYFLSDIILSASLEPEAFGRVAVEGQAMEKIVVATKLGGSCETIIHGETGFLIDPKNPADLVDNINMIANFPKEKRENIGKAARENVVKNFSSSIMANKTIDIYRELLK